MTSSDATVAPTAADSRRTAFTPRMYATTVATTTIHRYATSTGNL